MSARPVLVLGGTTEARRLAEALHADGTPVLTSLAGRTRTPRIPPGAVRTGGFGGADGLARWLRAGGARAVVDATHPFATRMTASAAAACASAGVPLVVLRRPGWHPQPGDRWIRVPDEPGAAAELISLGARRVLLTLGRQHLEPFRALERIAFVVRSVEEPDDPPPGAVVVLGRGPFTLDEERALLAGHDVDVLVTRDSGGAREKLDAAREREVTVVMIDRPPLPDGLRAVATVDAALNALAGG